MTYFGDPASIHRLHLEENCAIEDPRISVPERYVSHTSARRHKYRTSGGKNNETLLPRTRSSSYGSFTSLSLNPTVLPTSTASLSVIQEQPPLVDDDTDTLLDATQLHNGRRRITRTRDSVVTRRSNHVCLIALGELHHDRDVSIQDKLPSITGLNLEKQM